MRIRIQQLKLMRIHADPDTDPDPKPWLFGPLLTHSGPDGRKLLCGCVLHLGEVLARVNNHSPAFGYLFLSEIRNIFQPQQGQEKKASRFIPNLLICLGYLFNKR